MQRARHQRTIWHWIVAIPLGTALAVGVTYVASQFGNGRTDSRNPDAVWMFGFHTVRVDPGRHAQVQQLRSPGFGTVDSNRDAAYMYEATTGELGRIDARSARQQTRNAFSPWEPSLPDADLAVAGDNVWVQNSAREVTRLDDRSLQPRAEIHIAPSGASALAASRDGVIVASEKADAITLQRFDGAGRERAHTSLSIDNASGKLVGVALTRKKTWVAFEHSAVSVTDGDFAHRRRSGLPASAGSVIAVTATRDALWVTAENGAAAYRFADDAAAPVRVRLTPKPIASFAGQSDIAFGLGSVWILAPAADRGERASVVERIMPSTARVTSRLEAPASLFVGRIAVT